MPPTAPGSAPIPDEEALPVPTARPLAAPSPPVRFAAWPADTYARAQELWSSVAGRNASTTERLLAQEAEGTAVPAASTIRRWASEDGWEGQADQDPERTRGRTLRQLQAGWLAALQLAQTTLIDAMTGGLDGLPHGGAMRIKSAEVTLRTIERAGLLATLPDPPPAREEDLAALSVDEKLRRMRDQIVREKEAASRR